MVQSADGFIKSMDANFAPPQPNAAPLWNPIHSTVWDRPKTSFAQRVTVRPARTERFAEPSAWSVSAAKRRVDFLIAAAALLLSLPLLLLAALLVRFSSPGPIIFRQKRVGHGGRFFTVYKFRTMEFAPENRGASMTKRGDPRITTLGRFLRKYKLDELPQLFNVLRGDMSLVGPRPRLPHHMNDIDLPVRPGITGAATIAFRHEEDLLQHIPDHEIEAYNSREIIPLKARLDWNYMGRATLVSDIALLCVTVTCCLSGRRADPSCSLFSNRA